MRAAMAALENQAAAERIYPSSQRIASIRPPPKAKLMMAVPIGPSTSHRKRLSVCSRPGTCHRSRIQSLRNRQLCRAVLPSSCRSGRSLGQPSSSPQGGARIAQPGLRPVSPQDNCPLIWQRPACGRSGSLGSCLRRSSAASDPLGPVGDIRVRKVRAEPRPYFSAFIAALDPPLAPTSAKERQRAGAMPEKAMEKAIAEAHRRDRDNPIGSPAYRGPLLALRVLPSGRWPP